MFGYSVSRVKIKSDLLHMAKRPGKQHMLDLHVLLKVNVWFIFCNHKKQ